jgi:hypothetical protein
MGDLHEGMLAAKPSHGAHDLSFIEELDRSLWQGVIMVFDLGVYVRPSRPPSPPSPTPTPYTSDMACGCCMLRMATSCPFAGTPLACGAGGGSRSSYIQSVGHRYPLSFL